MRVAILGVGLAGLVACGVGDEPTVGVAPYAPGDGEFLVVVLPDTQMYALAFPETFDAQLRWVAQHADEYDIVYVTHVGDIVQHGDATEQWAVARAAFDWLDDAGVPYGFSVAGHDFSVRTQGHDSSCANFDDVDCDFTQYRETFPPERLEAEPDAGVSPSGYSSYQRIDAGAVELLFLHLPQDPPRAEVQWAGEVLDANPGTLAHVTTHRHLFDYRLTDWMPPPLDLLPAGRFSALAYAAGDQTLKFQTSVTAQELFDELVAPHPNVWAVHCGHVDAEFRQQATNEAGLPVHEILVDYQNMADGGGGFLRLLKFAPARDQVEVYSYSPLTDSLRANGDGFDHSLDILDEYQARALGELEDLGLDVAPLLDLLDQLRTDDALQAEYRESLYADGSRDSQFVLDVDFDAYLDATR
ncbi:MAG: hypothetical protein AAF211_20785 [Myxococcota bacterium]